MAFMVSIHTYNRLVNLVLNCSAGEIVQAAKKWLLQFHHFLIHTLIRVISCKDLLKKLLVIIFLISYCGNLSSVYFSDYYIYIVTFVRNTC